MDDTKGDKKEKFIELRAKEVSYDAIAKQLGVSKPTLISWSKELELEIQNLRELNKDNLRERFELGTQHRLEMFAISLRKLRQEFDKRDLSDIPTPQLLNMLMKVEDRIAQKDDGDTHLKEKGDAFSCLDLSTTEEWYG